MEKNRILVVDDEEVIRQLLVRTFKDSYNVEATGDVEEALKQVKEDSFPILIIDLRLPKDQGLDVIKEIRSSNSHIGIIVITGYPTIELAVDAMKLGVFDFISKPFDLEQLKTTVIKCLKEQKLSIDRDKLDETVGIGFKQQMIRRLATVIYDSNDAIILENIGGQIVSWNRGAELIYGYSEKEAIGMDARRLIPSHKEMEYKEFVRRLVANDAIRSFESQRVAKGGRILDIWMTVTKVVDGENKMSGILFTERDITERKHLEVEKEELVNKFKQLALKDSHTDLYNHRHLKDALETNFSRVQRQSGELSVIMMDLDYFKSVNDVYGHLFGDLVLKQFAGILTKAARSYDVVIRYGGEEFIIISQDTGRNGALILANRILEKVQLHNFGEKAHFIKLKLSLAVATYPDDNVRNGIGLVDLADQILNKAKESGGNRVFTSLDLKKVADTFQKTSDLQALKEKIKKLTSRANQSLVEEALAFAKALEIKDCYTGAHVERAVHYAMRISQKLNFPNERIELIKQAAMLHDLGKVGISDKILHKKSKLNKEEFAEIKRHPQLGVDIIRPIHSLHPVIPALLYHHERWDGKGYPFGLKKQQIPLTARIITIADVYQALVSDRPYRKAYSEARAAIMIKEASGTQFDPDIVKSFLRVLQEENGKQ